MEAQVEAIREALLCRLPWQRKTQRDKLSVLIAVVLRVQSANLMKWGAALPRQIKDKDVRYQYIERFLSNPRVDVAAVMRPFAQEVLNKASKKGQTIVLMMDQSQIRGDLQLLMVSVRVGNRALPVLWSVAKTEGNIGFEDQKRLLDQVITFIPAGKSVLLAGDRFYGTANLILWCQKAGWDYRLRFKGNTLVYQNVGEKSLHDLYQEGQRSLPGARLVSGATTNIGIVHEAGHPEPWFIAMSAKPTAYTALDYGMRWGIESLFSDLKSRGFDITATHMRKTERLERMLLVLSLAMYWAVSTGLWVKTTQTIHQTLKKNSAHSPPSLPKDSATSSPPATPYHHPSGTPG